MIYVIQENTFREQNYDNLSRTLDRLGLGYHIVRSFPFSDKIANILSIPEDTPYELDDLPEIELPENEKIFCFGSVKLARLAKDRNWSPGSLQSSEHDLRIYGPHYGTDMLNHDCKHHCFSDTLGWRPGQNLFIRPSEDNKTFTGRTFTQEDWEEFVEHSLNNGHKTTLDKDTPIISSTPKKIYNETRFWSVGGKIVTGSIYKRGERVIYDRNVDPDSMPFAQSMVDRFQVADAFVIDVCLTDNGWKVIECNCINSAGFYDADIQKIIISLENFY